MCDSLVWIVCDSFVWIILKYLHICIMYIRNNNIVNVFYIRFHDRLKDPGTKSNTFGWNTQLLNVYTFWISIRQRKIMHHRSQEETNGNEITIARQLCQRQGYIYMKPTNFWWCIKCYLTLFCQYNVTWASWHLKPPEYRLFVQQLSQPDNKEHKAPHYWAFVRKSTGHQWIHCKKVSKVDNITLPYHPSQ